MGTTYYNFGYVASGSAAKEVQVNATFDEIDATLHGLNMLSNPMTLAGDIIYEATSPPLATRLPIGTTGQVLTVAAGLPRWSTLATGFVSPMSTGGDIIYETVSPPIAARLPIGTTGQVLTVAGGVPAWMTPSSGFANPMTTGGDIIFESVSPPIAARLPIGTTGQVLTVASGLPSWANASSGFTNPMTTTGDIIYENSTPAAARLAIGTTGQVLTVAAGVPTWATPSGGGGGGATVPALSSFTWVNQSPSSGSSSARQTVASGPIEMTIHDGVSVLQWTLLTVAAPSTPYKLTVNMRGYQPSGSADGSNSATFGVYFYDGTKLEGWEMLLQASGAMRARVEKITNVNADGSTAFNGSGAGVTIVNAGLLNMPAMSNWWQLRNNGTTMYFDYSVDGANYINAFSEAVGTFLTPTNIGFGGLSITSAAQPNIVVNLLSWTVAANATL